MISHCSLSYFPLAGISITTVSNISSIKHSIKFLPWTFCVQCKICRIKHVSKISKGSKIGKNLAKNTPEISPRKFKPNLPLFFVGVPNKEECGERKKRSTLLKQFQFEFEFFFEWNSPTVDLRSITFV